MVPAAPGVSHALRIAVRLIVNDCKQGLRKHLSGRSLRDRLLRAFGGVIGLSFFVGLHIGAFTVFTYTAMSPSRDKAALIAGLSTSVWSFLLFVMFSGGLVRALVVLHEQDDSSLLMSSPVSPRAILAGRLFGNALQSCLVDGFIIVPYINVRVFTAQTWQFHFLWGYAVWFALAVLVTCLDGLFSFGLIRVAGLRRARFFAQAVPFILIFAVTFFAGTMSVQIAELNAGAEHMAPAMQEHFIALAHTPLAWLARAAAGNPIYLAGIFSAAAALAMITLRLTERAFIDGTQNVVENETSARPGSAEAPFRAGLLRLEVSKNLRMVVRTPMMLVQCLAQSLMPVGIACVLGRDHLAPAVALFVIFTCGVLSGMFTIAAGTVEECGDLLAMAPRPVLLFRLGKIASGALFPVGAALVAGIGLLLVGETLLAGAVLLGGVPLGIASAVCGETFSTPVKPGVKPKLMADPIMMIPLLGMQIISGAVAFGTIAAAALSPGFFGVSLVGTYLVLVLCVGLAQLKKPLLSN
jgi:ABC-2 type transport system permease protein